MRSASITGLLRQGQKFGRLIDSPDIDHIIEMVRRHADLTEPVTRSYFDLIKMLVDSQKVPFSESLSVFRLGGQRCQRLDPADQVGI